MRKLNLKNTIKLISLGFAFVAMLVLSVLSVHSVSAETSVPYDASPPPMTPELASCMTILSATPVGTATNGEARMALFYNCIAEHYQEIAAWQERTGDWWYRRQESIAQGTEFKIKLAAMGALLDSMAYFTTNFAYDTANMILGVDRPDGKPSFYEADFGDYLEYHADQASGVFFERFDAIGQFSADFGSGDQTSFGFTTLCKKPSPLDIRLGLGMSDMGPLNGATCTLSAMVDNFDAIADMINSGDALNIHRASFEPYGNDLHVGLEIQSNYVDAILSEDRRAKLSRQESEGMVPVIDKITQRIQWPSLMANEGMRNIEPTAMAQVQNDKQEAYMVQAFWETGLEGLGFLTLSTFLNRLAFGFLQKLLTPSDNIEGTFYGDTQKYNVIFNSLVNEDASGDTQNYYERQAFAKSLGDFIIPSFYSQEDKDLVTELSTCSAMRTKWNCAMDQALAIAINLGSRDGALTVGKATGIGNENSSSNPRTNGLNPNWELIPESDIANNTDPSCYQRAYCAGNLKKLRLARILPIGFEMAANSPYNIKHNGSYVTLGEVVRGFYNCNDEGKLDKDHPWCHLIDPNWILAAPNYQCRSVGYGDTLMPELGIRQEECGDMVSCLGTDQKGECVDGYGYCLAERPIYKFDSPECSEQYASCRTYQSSKGEPLSALRYTVERGACSAENIGCMWFATNRYVTSSASPDGLWEGTLTEGSRVYLDGGAEPCSSEGCTKVYNFKPGESAFNLINNSSFEKVTEVEQNGALSLQGIDSWSSANAVYQNINTTEEAYDGTRSLTLDSAAGYMLYQVVPLTPNRNYTLSFYFKSKINYGDTFGRVNMDFFNDTAITSQNRITTEPANFEDCYWDDGGNRLTFKEIPGDQEWHRLICQFVSPADVVVTRVYINLADFLYIDAIELEEGEYVTDYVEELAELDESHIKIAPDEYECTGNDDEDHPSCKNFARVCRQTEVGCQGYTDVNDPTAPEIPATLTAKDYCPSVCSSYGEYRKLASSFDLVYNPVYPEYSDPADDGKAYLIPSASQSCTLQNVGCEPFTSLEASSQGGEQVAYYDNLRTCEKPNDLSRTYFTWEGSDNEGYVLRTWALVASSNTSNKPKVVLKGASFGDIKDPDSCNEDLWDAGIDQDCRQFYDESGAVYYAYYSQTVSSDSACTLYRKDDSSEVDCSKTGGHEFVPQSGSCLYYALPNESSVCPATAGGCRAYLGPTGRNAVQTYYQAFMDDGSESGFESGLNSTIARSEESVLVGDYSLKIDAVGGSNIQFQTDIPLITTTTLYRISFWAKSLASDQVAVTIDGDGIGSFTPTTIWQRFEIGPFEVEDTTSTLAFSAPSALGSLFVDTIKLDQLNDIRFLIKNSWVIPATCDATVEGTPEPRAMLGCNEYVDRDGNQIFARNFSNLCRADSIGCKAFVDTRSVANPYPESRTITGTPGPSARNDADARAYEEQYLGDWSITSQPWRYYYAIDDSRARCDESENSCRAFGKPRFAQDRLNLKTTDYAVDPADTDLLAIQDTIYEFETVLLKHNWDAYYNSDGSLGLACRKDELHCDKFQSGNVTEYFRNPGDHTCEWRDAKQLDANPDIGIYTDGNYGGWFRTGTDSPCYPGDDALNKTPYLKNGVNFGAYFTGEDQYSGWVSGCPVDQSECTEFVDPNDTSDPSNPTGRSYFMINSKRIDTNSCGGSVEPLAGCVLFNNKSFTELYANSKATYSKIEDEHGAPQNSIDCVADPGNPYCLNFARCGNITSSPSAQGIQNSAIYNSSIKPRYEELQLKLKDFTCQTDADCIFPFRDYPNSDVEVGTFSGECISAENDSNVVIKVKLDRECARWMGCETGETVYDPAQQKYVTQCSELQLCEQSGSSNEDIYCSRFTDRKIEPLLKEGQFISLDSYSSRSVGFGKLDYSGYSIPNQYTLPDIVTRPVGFDILPTATKDAYEYDNRLVASVSINLPDITLLPDDSSYPGLKLCRDERTGRIGYYLNTDGNCHFAINEPQALSLIAGQTSKDISRDITEIYKSFSAGTVSRQNTLLQSALPAPECQLYPERTSPLPNSYVVKWNEKASPPVPETMADGYEAAKACVYGEDCSCSYRKVRYQSGMEQYYSIDGKAPSVGICVGGDKEGESCVPGGFIPVNSSDQVIANTSQNFLGNQASQCGGTGVCASIQDVVIQNGLFAYCLERDRTRTNGISQDSAPCLTWSPVSVIGGKYDTTHYAPTAGYLPPQGAGEYYCMTGGNEQKLETPSTKIRHDEEVDNTWQEDFWMPGKLWEFAFSRSEVWWVPKESTASNIAIDGVNNITFIGSTKEETLDRIIIKTDSKGDPDPATQPTIPSSQTKNLRFACRRATICEGRPDSNDDLDFNDKEGRWIMTGDSLTNSYMEYFIPSGPGIDWINDNYYDYRYGLFRFSLSPYAAGTACKWNPKWVGMDYPTVDQAKKDDVPISSFSCQAYLQQTQQNSQQFISTFKSKFPGVLDRSSEKVLRDDQGAPVKLKCAIGTDGSCYYKYWETGYENNGQEQFAWPFKVYSDKLETFNFKEQYKSYYSHECSAGSPYFGIRAMFQNVNKRDNRLETDEANNVGFEGPWQFIGFWFTTCLPTDRRNDPGWLYMRMDTVSADVCKEVGQVIAPTSRENAAFADRVWSQGKFLLPVLGLKYESRNEPHGSALATDKIGSDPMLLGASVPTSGALNKAPGFIDSGLTTSAVLSQQNSWVPLTNLFARVYKVYRWDPNPVESGDWTCVKGSQIGKSCYTNSNAYDGLKVCGDYATCDTNIDVNIKNQNWRCNTLSGVNRGLHCGDDPYPARNTDVICHNAAIAWSWNEVKLEEETLPLYSACQGGGILDFYLPTTQFGMCDGGSQQLNQQLFYLSPNTLWCDEWYTHGGGTGGAGYMATPYERDDNSSIRIRFSVKDCGDGNYIADPINPGKQTFSTASVGYSYSTPLVVVYGLLKMAVNDSQCQEDVNGIADDSNLVEDLKVIIDNYKNGDGSLLQGYKQVVGQIVEMNDWPAYTNNDHIIEQFESMIYRWEANDAQIRYNLGRWNGNVVGALTDFTCASDSVRAGLACPGKADESDYCPTKVSACSGSYKTKVTSQGQTVPTCGYCNKDSDDPYNINYPNDDNTGYCEGFNPLARCHTNADCTFTEFEYWGTRDDGSASGIDYERVGEKGGIFWKVNDPGFRPEDVIPEPSKLPLPLFEGSNDVPATYSQPATYKQVGFNNDDYFDEYFIAGWNTYGVNGTNVKFCKDIYWHNICYTYYSKMKNDDQKYDEGPPSISACESFCGNAYQMIPNSYANSFDSIVDETNGVKLRTAAVAPFVVNPIIRNTLSRGHLAIDFEGDDNVGMKLFYYYIMGEPNGGNWYSDIYIYGNYDNIPEVDDADSVAYYLKNGTYIKKSNDSFPWRADKLFFTTIFPLAINNGRYSQPEDVDAKVNSPIYFFDKYWEGYGMSRDLFEFFKKTFDLQNVQEIADNQEALEEQSDIDMQENFFKETGWGTFMSPQDQKLQLYPGAIPAAVPKNSDKKELTVYVPGHCEPPIGGTDTDSIDGEPESIILFTHEEHVAAGFPDVWSGADNEAEYHDGQGVKNRSLLMPWGGVIDFAEEEYQLEAGEWGSTVPEKYIWTAPYVQPKSGVEGSTLPITCDDCPIVTDYRNTCRCVGGKRNGTVQEGEADCNIGLPEALNPDNLSAAERSEPSDYCKANATYINNEWVPIAECQAPTGIPNHEDPDLDDNMCTHRAGYVPRGDICADGRDNCLVTYNVSDPVSTDHVTKVASKLAAPSATDVTSGLDTYWFLTGGKVQRLNKEYSAWYRPRPPQIAAPDSTKSGTSSNAQPVVIMDAFSVDGLPSGLVYYGGGQGLATIRFYAWAMHNQGPLESIVIDWGDGSVQNISDAQMKNSKPVCNTMSECEFVPGLACGSDSDCPPGAGACKELGNCRKQSYKECREDSDCGPDDSCEARMFFGNSTEACRQGYFEFQHIYRCNDDSAEAYDASCGTAGRCSMDPSLTCNVNTDCPRPEETCRFDLAPQDGCYAEDLYRCRFTPRIQVKDSWGWCTGNCSVDNEPYPGGPLISSSNKQSLIRHPYGGCYDGSETKINEEVMNMTGGNSPSTLVNECSMTPVNDILRPWIIYDGAIEVEDSTREYSQGGTVSLKSNLLLKPSNVLLNPPGGGLIIKTP
ncbi:MAG: hypothetical protein P1P90_01535 [Patescibacteria group bacterium]|nr:hypothetical protein [Patescibacteria group bacterium]